MTRTTRRACPECESHDTERVHTEWYTNSVEEVRICHDCPTQYTLSYGHSVVEDVHTDQ